MLGRLVEMSLNPETAEVEIRPRDVDARLEIDWYASVDSPGVAALEKAARQIIGIISPADVVRNEVEYTIAELLSNARLAAALAARLQL